MDRKTQTSDSIDRKSDRSGNETGKSDRPGSGRREPQSFDSLKTDMPNAENRRMDMQEPEVKKPYTENIGDEIREQRKLLKGKGVKAYLEYFWDYYRWQTVACIAGILIVGSIVQSRLSYREPCMTAYFLNTQALQESIDSFTAAFTEYADIDESSSPASLDLTLSQTPGTSLTEVDVSSEVKIMALASTGDLDVLVADAWNFRSYAENGGFLDLRTVLSQEQLELYEDRFFYVDEAVLKTKETEYSVSDETESYVSAEEGYAYEAMDSFSLPDPEEMEDPVPVGVLLNGSDTLEEYGLYEDTAALFGFFSSCTHQDMALALFTFIMG